MCFMFISHVFMFMSSNNKMFKLILNCPEILGQIPVVEETQSMPLIFLKLLCTCTI